MRVKIKKVANVQMGYSFRSRIEASKNGAVSVIQMKDLLDNNIVDYSNLIKIDMDSIKQHHLVKKGDLIFRSRGLVSTSVMVINNLANTIVSAPLLRIRVKNTDELLPEYLNWYISQRDAQMFFTSRARGSTQKMINMQTIKELEITLPTIDKQKLIVELASLVSKEQLILKTIAEKKTQYISALLMQSAKDN